MRPETPRTIAIDARIINSSTGRYIERLLHYLEKIDKTNLYLILVRKKDLDFYKPSNPNFRIIEADFANYSFAEQIGLNKLLRRLKPDLVHFCMPQQPLLYSGLGVTTVHDLNLLRITSNDDMGKLELIIKKAIFSALLLKVARRTAHILVPTNYTKNDLIDFSHISPGKITLTYEGADTVNAAPKTVPTLKGQEFILYVGRAEPYKNNRGLIEAHQELLLKHPRLKLVIVGKKDTLRQSDMAWVAKNNFKQVEFLGFVDDSELAWLYQNCKAYVVPSLMEGFGLPGLEAIGSGAPVVSSNATCLPEVYQDAAHYFDPHDTRAMTIAIDDVLTDTNLRDQLVFNGRKVHSKYSWQRMAEQTLEVYKKVLKEA